MIDIGTDEFRVNDQATDALGSDPDVYQRGGVLVYLQEQGENYDRGELPPIRLRDV